MRATIGLLTMLGAAPLAAQTPAVAPAECALPLVPPLPWAGWNRPGPLVAAERIDVRPAIPLVPGRAVSVTFAPGNAIAFAVSPARPTAPTGYGGMLSFMVPVAGTYRIAIGARAWIDVASGGRLLASVAHDHGPACSGIVKTVDFVLPAGKAVIEISGAPTPVATMMAVRVS